MSGLMERDDALGKLDTLVGCDVRKLADELKVTVWKDGKLNKGWVGYDWGRQPVFQARAYKRANSRFPRPRIS